MKTWTIWTGPIGSIEPAPTAPQHDAPPPPNPPRASPFFPIRILPPPPQKPPQPKPPPPAASHLKLFAGSQRTQRCSSLVIPRHLSRLRSHRVSQPRSLLPFFLIRTPLLVGYPQNTEAFSTATSLPFFRVPIILYDNTKIRCPILYQPTTPCSQFNPLSVRDRLALQSNTRQIEGLVGYADQLLVPIPVFNRSVTLSLECCRRRMGASSPHTDLPRAPPHTPPPLLPSRPPLPPPPPPPPPLPVPPGSTPLPSYDGSSVNPALPGLSQKSMRSTRLRLGRLRLREFITLPAPQNPSHVPSSTSYLEPASNGPLRFHLPPLTLPPPSKIPPPSPPPPPPPPPPPNPPIFFPPSRARCRHQAFSIRPKRKRRIPADCGPREANPRFEQAQLE